MTDSLFTAAERFGVAIDESAGPDSMPGAHVWARWPRNRLEVAHELLNEIMALHADAVVTRHGPSGQWRARCGSWIYEGRFEEAVAALGLYLTDNQRAGRGRQGIPANLRLGA